MLRFPRRFIPSPLLRQILTVACWIAAAGLSHFAGARLPASEPSSRPNIVLIMADDLGWSDIGCYGGEIRTPHIDAVAQQGLRFTQFYNNAICGPTRASLLTGLYCQQVGHRGDRWNEPKDYSKCALVSELLQRAGYRTMMCGKWQGRDSAVDRGFDRFFGPMCQAKISYFHEVQQNPYYLDRQRWAAPPDFYLTSAINEFAVTFLREAVRGEAPFFLYVAQIAPHWPLHARAEDIAANRRQYRGLGWDRGRAERFARQKSLGLAPEHWQLGPRPASVRDWQTEVEKDWQAERMAAYAAQVEAIDHGVGQIVQVLKESGRADNTLLLFLSDNGAAPDGGLVPSESGFGFSPQSDNRRWRIDGGEIRPGSGPNNLPGPGDTFAAYGLAWANLSNTPFRGAKLSGYEGGIRTPLIASWPDAIRGGQQSRQVGHVIDIMATCLDIARVEYPTEFQGRRPLPLEGASLKPVFEGRQRQPPHSLCWSVPQHEAIRMGDWKAVRPRNGKPWQLYDLQADGGETKDLAAAAPERVAELAEQFERWKSRVGAE